MALRDRQQAQQPMPIQSAMPAPAQAGGANPMQGTGGVPALILAKLLQQKQAQAQQQQPQTAQLPWRDQPMYLGGDPNQTYNKMGDWRQQPAYLQGPQQKKSNGLFGLGILPGLLGG